MDLNNINIEFEYVAIASQALIAGAVFGGIVILIGYVIGFVIKKIGGE